MEIEFINKITKKIYNLSGLTDTHISNMFYNFNITIPEMEIGEYEYRLKDEDNVIASGLAIVGDYKAEPQEYNNKDKKPYKTYGE